MNLRPSLAALCLPLVVCAAPRPVSADDVRVPPGWFIAGKAPGDYQMGLDRGQAHTGRGSAVVRARVPHPASFGTLMQTFAPDDYRDRRLRLSAWMKSDAVESWAGMWMRVDGESGRVLSFDNMQSRAIKGTTDWRRYDIVLDVPREATLISLGLLLDGPGAIWIDDIAIDQVSRDVPTTDMVRRSSGSQPRNLGFEE